MKVATTYDLDGCVLDVEIGHGVAYTAMEGAGVDIWKFNIDEQPVLLAHLSEVDPLRIKLMDDNTLYIYGTIEGPDQDSVGGVVVDTQDPVHPRIVGRLVGLQSSPVSNEGALAGFGLDAVITNGRRGLFYMRVPPPSASTVEPLPSPHVTPVATGDGNGADRSRVYLPFLPLSSRRSE